LENGSRDNFSVAHLAYFKNEQLNTLLAFDQKIIATICDGHGKGTEYIEGNTIDEGDKRNWSGGFVSNSVSADVHVSCGVIEILGCEIDPEEQGCLHESIASRSSENTQNLSNKDCLFPTKVSGATAKKVSIASPSHSNFF
jgi:hypothetical protein